MFRFANPDYLLALYLIPIFIAVYVLLYRKKIKLLTTFAEKKLFDVLFGSKSFFKEHFKFSISLITVALLILAVARPQIGSRIEEVKQIGIDVYILLDVSMSMKAEDIRPNRLEKAKNEITSLVRKLQGDRIGLIVFAGQAYIQFPLTTDYSAANLFLSVVDVNTVPQAGTAIASAINLAVKSFDFKSSTKKVIVVITDGEDHEGDISASVKNAVEKDVMIYTIGMGSVSGAPIPVYDNRGSQAGFKQDREGNIVLTKLDEATLRQIASEGNGKYYLSSNFSNELDMIYKDLASIEKEEYGSKKITDYDDKYYYFLIPAILLLFIEFFITEQKSRFFRQLYRKYKISNN
ncbi:MAG TPA: VWA domain-containing protein [Ignavibacteriaceae bacterium]|jgi:Ca-activated chloride channel family protein|nr:VWA domain-containing protein [Ignavibacteriaceae bacterium]